MLQIKRYVSFTQSLNKSYSSLISGIISSSTKVIMKIKGKPRSLFCNKRIIEKLIHIIIYNENKSVELICENYVMLVKGLLNGHLDSPQSKFQISNYHLPRRKLFSFFVFFFIINTFMRTLNQGAYTSFSKQKYFGNKLE
jgi:hypothetical protein